jgi:hypothetical protein
MFNQKVDYKSRILAKLNEIEEYDPKGQTVSLNLITGRVYSEKQHWITMFNQKVDYKPISRFWLC